jgi:Dockerin type I domain
MRLARLVLCTALMPLADASALKVEAQVKTFTLGETLFVSEKKDVERDHDNDGLKDDLEAALAEHFRPRLVFDSDESHRLPGEPVTLFQERPIGCTGVGCPGRYRILIKYGFLFRRDGGYGESSDCWDDHNGDNQPATFELDSADGKDWTLNQVSNGSFVWPANRASGDKVGVHQIQWHLDSHPIIYMSAHKHHQYFNTNYDEDDSIYSGYDCNDDVNGKGAKVMPSLISPYPDHRPNNVGEPELKVPRKCLQYEVDINQKLITVKRCVKWAARPDNDVKYFITDLGPFGYPSEDAWGSSPFCGGLGCDSDETSPMSNMWERTEFSFTGQYNWEFYETLGGLKGRITDVTGKPIPGLRLYYRPLHPLGLIFGQGFGPWSTLPVNANGYYQVRVPLGAYLIRPAASDYSFKEVPQWIEAKKGDYAVTDFVGKYGGTSREISPTGGQGNPRSAPDDRSLTTSATSRRISEAKKMDIVKHVILHTDLPYQGMAAFDPEAEYKGEGETDPVVQLPRKYTLRFHVERVLDNNGNSAKTLDEATCTAAYSTYTKLPDGTVVTNCKLGGPVQGAKIQVRLRDGMGFVTPQSAGWVEVTTNSKGNAYLNLQSGVHPGWTQLEVKLTSNPANPWGVFDFAKERIELQPAIHGDDVQPGPKVVLLVTQVNETDFPARWWRKGQRGSARESVARIRGLQGDVNFDRAVDQKDLELVRKFMGKNMKQGGYKAFADLNDDGVIDEKDAVIVQQNLGQSLRPPGTRRAVKP